MKTYTIRQILFLIVFSLVIPACLIATGFSLKAYYDGRDSVTSATLQTAHAMTLVVERELGALQSTTETLAYSSLLQSGNLAAFQAQAQEVLRKTSGFTIVLSDRNGQQLVNTLKPYGSVLPRHGSPALVARVFATGKPAISDLFYGGITKKPVISISIPVIKDGKVLYALDIAIWPEQISKILIAQNIPQDWVVSIFDSSSTIVARNKAADKFIGKLGAPALLREMAIKPEGIVETATLEGIPVYSMFSRSISTGWSVAIGVPTSTVSAGLWHSLWLMTVGTVALLLLGLWIASLAAARITRSFQVLIPQAMALGRGELVEIPAVAVREAVSVGSAMAKASELLRLSESNREHAEEALRAANAELEWRVDARTTELHEAVQQLGAACLAADAANAAKSSFVANMSHEIRTPMNAVLGLLQLVQKTALDSRQQDYVSKAQSAAKSLLGLLNDILDFSKMEAGKLQLDLHAFDLEGLMRDLAVVLSGAQADTNVEVIFEIDTALPLVMRGDGLRFQQILTNLAGNAVKFTETGQVVIRVTQVARAAGQLTLRVEVIDTGIGMSPEHLARIFDSFTQAEVSTTRRFGGTGLGLVISERLIALMGGNLSVQSELGKGTRFWFDLSLPLEDVNPVAVSPEALPETLSILVVDDNPLSREILTRTLQAMGATAHSASSGAEGVDSVRRALLHSKPYDVVLMDWRMPGMDGLAAASLIRQSLSGGQLPVIIMVTAFGREILAEAEDLPDAPFVDFLTKPVTPRQLVAAVQKALADPVAQVDLQPGKPLPPLRLEGIHILLVEDNALNRQVATELLQAEGAVVALAEGGVQGVYLATQPLAAFDVVIMDVQMPEVDGLEATRRIRASAHGQRLPILAMTANASRADRDDCLAAGMNDHIAKPIDIDELVDTLLALLGRSFGTALVAETKVEDVLDPPDIILRRFGNKVDIYHVALSGFKAEGARLMTELRRHVRDGNLAQAGATMHAMKGVAATVGAAALARLADELERRARTEAGMTADALFSDEIAAALTNLIDRSDAMLAATMPRGFQKIQ